MTIYERVVQWERCLAGIRGSCIACVFPDGYEGANKMVLAKSQLGTSSMPWWAPTAGKLRRRTRTLSTLSVTFHDHPTTCSRLAFGELLQSKEYALKLIRSVYSRLKWGKGLSAISHQIWELMEKVERENRLQGRPCLWW